MGIYNPSSRDVLVSQQSGMLSNRIGTPQYGGVQASNFMRQPVGVAGNGPQLQSSFHGSGGVGGGSSQHSSRGGEDEFNLENEDFPALPGSQLSKNTDQQQQHHHTGNIVSSRTEKEHHLSSEGAVGSGYGAAVNHVASMPSHSYFSNGSGLGGAMLDAGASGPSGNIYGASSSNSSSIIDSQSNSTGLEVNLNLTRLNGTASLINSAGASAVAAQLQQKYIQSASQFSPKDVKYGFGGLLELIRNSDRAGTNSTAVAQTDRDLSALALGIDLVNFGLNINSQEALYPTFVSPFSEQSTAQQDPQFSTPQCYNTHPPTLKSEHLSKFQLETLFYMFYTLPRDLLQACGAQELYRREWRYHEELKLWMKRRAAHEIAQSNPNIQWMYFDVSEWDARPFSYRGGDITQGFLSEEAIRIKPPVPPSAATSVGGQQQQQQQQQPIGSVNSAVGNAIVGGMQSSSLLAGHLSAGGGLSSL